jgi:hypothetical protein
VTGDEQSEARISLDLGAGFRPEEGRAVRVNGTGLRFVRDEVCAQSIRGVRIQLGDGPGTARIDFMRLAFRLSGRDQPVLVEIEWPEQFASVRYEDAAALSPNLVFGARRPPAVLYRCPSEWGLDAYKVELEIAYAWLPTAPLPTARASRTAVARQVGRRVGGKVRTLWQTAEQVAGERARPLEMGQE